MSRGDEQRPIDRIAPDGFVDKMDEDVDTIAEALAVAERLPSSTPREERRRCRECLSLKAAYRPDSDVYACGECNATYPSPLPSPADARRRADHALDDEAECPVCDSTDRYPVPETVAGIDAKYVCLSCGARYDDPSDAPDPTPAPIMPRKLSTPTEEYGIPTGDDLRELREGLDLSLRAVPVAAPGTIRRWEREEVAPRLDRLEELVEYYRAVDAARRAVRLDAALDEAEEEPSPEPVSPDAEPDPFDWVDEDDLRAATGNAD